MGPGAARWACARAPLAVARRGLAHDGDGVALPIRHVQDVGDRVHPHPHRLVTHTDDGGDPVHGPIHHRDDAAGQAGHADTTRLWVHSHPTGLAVYTDSSASLCLGTAT